jgi:hypothetical protein
VRSHLIRYLTGALFALLASAPVSAATPDTYRDFALRDSTAAVMARAQVTARDLKTLHERPAVLQELAWRPPSSTRTVTDRDSIAVIVFSFLDDQLFRMAVEYDRRRTEGLTARDMIEALSAIYGPRSAPPARAERRPAYDRLDAPTAIASWREGDTTIVLNELVYSGGFGLVITSTVLEAAARKTQAAAVAIEAREAPARDAARARAQADAARAAADKVRTTNKGRFEP